ncbi:MAG: DUF2771 family protein [Gordonia sp. (in: high G+C Gram-positive bacteria)]|uniref:DUF2771 family protein n=1 Tax=Gordonia sp. (in: high G+C Gram-positive bacteria) TaxID=84139 RepID=UPI0039E654EB
MSLQPQDRKALAVLAATAVAVVALIAGLTTVLVKTVHHDDLPQVSVAADGHGLRADPVFWCDLKLTECKPFDPRPLPEIPITPVGFPVATGSTLTLSVPEEVSAGPWSLVAQYSTPKGLQAVQWIHHSGTTFTQLLPSTPDRVLMGVEITPLSAVLEDTTPEGFESGQGSLLPRAMYSIKTAPGGYTVPNETELPGIRGESSES